MIYNFKKEKMARKVWGLPPRAKLASHNREDACRAGGHRRAGGMKPIGDVVLEIMERLRN